MPPYSPNPALIAGLTKAQKPSFGQVMESRAVKEALTNPQIEATYDVPYGAGASQFGIVTHVDRRLPRFDPRVIDKSGRPLDLYLALNAHEQVERQAMAMGVPYEEAHKHYATVAERNLVEGMGGDWKKYEESIDGFLNETEHEKPQNPPPALYDKPYPHDKRVLLERLEKQEMPKQADPTVINALMSGGSPNGNEK